MTKKHTPEPWVLTHDERPELGGAFFTVRDENGGPIAIILDPDQDTVEDNDVAGAEEANANRVIDCVNACEGIKKPMRAINDVLTLLRHNEEDLRMSGMYEAASDLKKCRKLLGDS